MEVRTELRQIQQKFGITTMYVTHDQDEALSMSDIIAVMRRGRIEQIGSPWGNLLPPRHPLCGGLVGTVNFLEGTAHREADGSLSVDHRGMRLRVDEDTANAVRELLNDNEVHGVYLETDAKRYYPYGSLAARHRLRGNGQHRPLWTGGPV